MNHFLFSIPKCKIMDKYKEEREMSFFEFVNRLFDSARDPKRAGLFMMREDGHNTHIEIIPFENRIEIKMDGILMGRFEEYNGQGYKCAFSQQPRKGIRKGLTVNELLMKSFCNHPLVLFNEA